MLLILAGCSPISTDVFVERQISDNIFLGISEYEAIEGLWGKIDRYDSLRNKQYYKLIFLRPDTIFVEEDNYILMKRKNRYCLVIKDTTQEFLKVYKTRNYRELKIVDSTLTEM